MKTQRTLTRVKVGFAVAATLGLSAVAGPAATAQPRIPAPHVVVTPSEDLPAKADVLVKMSGFEPESAVFIQECAEVGPNIFGCDYDHTAAVDLDGEGAGAARVTARRVFEAHSADGDLLDVVDCVRVPRGCYISVGNFEGARDAEISFRDDD